MGSFRQTLRDLPFIGYFLRVVYSVWKLPEMWDVLTGAVPVARPARDTFTSGEERINWASGGTAAAPNSGPTPSVMDLTARVIDLTALVREQAIAWAQHQERLYSSVPVYVGGERLLVRTEGGQLLMCNAQDIQLTPQLIDRRVWHPALTTFYQQNIQAGMKYRVFYGSGLNLSRDHRPGARLRAGANDILFVENQLRAEPLRRFMRTFSVSCVRGRWRGDYSG
jgi:hypothetical protein